MNKERFEMFMEPSGKALLRNCILILSLMLLVNSAAWAQDTGAQITRVEQTIRKLADHVRSIADDKSMRNVTALVSQVKKARTEVVKLARIGGGDDRAEKLVKEYGSNLHAFAQAVEEIADLKDLQFKAVDGAESCKKAEDDLYSEIEKIVRSGDSDVAKDIEVLVLGYSKDTKELLAHFGRTLKIASQEQRSAKRFNESDGPWRAVDESIDRAADAMLRDLEKDVKDASRSCKTLVSGLKNAKVKRYLEAVANAPTTNSSGLTEDELRAELRRIDESIIEQLGDINESLKTVPSDSGTRGVDQAIKLLRPLGRTIVELKPLVNVKTDDRATKSELKKSKQQFREYPKALKDLAKSLATLRSMKDIQTELDDIDDVCEEAESEFNDDIEAWVKKGGEDAVDSIDDEIGELGGEIAALVKTSTRFMTDFEKEARAAKQYAYRKGKWGPIDHSIDKASDALNAYVADAHKSLIEKCEPLLSPYELAVVENAIAELKDFKERVEDFVASSENWFKNSRDSFSYSCKTLNEIRDIACAEDFNTTNDPDIPKVKSKINSLTTASLSQLKPLLPAYKKLQRTGEALLKQEQDKEVKRRLTSMEKRVLSLQKTLESGQLSGSRNPFIQMAIAYGIAHHKDLESVSTFDCVVADVAIPNLRVRPDCISVRNCTIYEFKPDNAAQIAAGKRQASSYAKEVEKYTNSILSERYKRSTARKAAEESDEPLDAKEQQEDAVEGNAYLEALWNHHCITNEGKVIFDYQVITYDKCESELKLQCPVE